MVALDGSTHNTSLMLLRIKNGDGRRKRQARGMRTNIGEKRSFEKLPDLVACRSVMGDGWRV